LRQSGRSFEFIFVLDGGFEKAATLVEPLVSLGEPIRILTLPRTFGEATALMVGFERAQGEILISLSSSLQVMPVGIEQILQALDNGSDFVVARRCPRVDSWINQLQTRMFSLLIRYLTGIEFHDLGCRLRGWRRNVVHEIHLYGDRHRFFPLLAYQRGSRVTEVNIPQHPNDNQMRIYQPGIYLRRLLDTLTLVFLFRFARQPLRFFGLVGAWLVGGGVVISVVLTIQRLVLGIPLADRPLLILGVLLMVLGVQIGSLGLLGELITFTHARKMSDYTIEKMLT
jgi:glycosyltransferase involved in cell wall biosynthesis